MTPAAPFVEESHSTLKFASRAKHVAVKPRINELGIGASGEQNVALQKEIERLQQQMQEMKQKLEAQQVVAVSLINPSLLLSAHPIAYILFFSNPTKKNSRDKSRSKRRSTNASTSA